MKNKKCQNCFKIPLEALEKDSHPLSFYTGCYNCPIWISMAIVQELKNGM